MDGRKQRKVAESCATAGYHSKIPLKLTSKLYKAVMRPAVCYGSDCWAVKKNDANRPHISEKMDALLDADQDLEKLSQKWRNMRKRENALCTRNYQMPQTCLAWNRTTKKKSRVQDILSKIQRTGRRGGFTITWQEVVQRDMEDKELNTRLARNL